MVAKQLSVFIENRQGRLGEVLNVLKVNKVNILSLSLADTTEYGLLRLIVNNPELGKEKLAEEGFSTILTDVLVLKISHQSGSLQELLKVLSDNDVNIEYMYGLSIDGDEASVVLKTSNITKAEEVLLCVLVLAVMIALATPFGSFISEAVQSTTKGLFDVNKSALDSTGLINIGNQEFDVPDMNHGAGENGGAPVEPVESTFTIVFHRNDKEVSRTTYTFCEGETWLEYRLRGGEWSEYLVDSPPLDYLLNNTSAVNIYTASGALYDSANSYFPCWGDEIISGTYSWGD